MIVNCWRRVLFIFGLLTPRQLCSKRSPRPSEEDPGGLCHSLSVDLLDTSWAQTGLINGRSGNTFGTGLSDSVIIGVGPNYGVIFGAVTKIRP